MSELCDVHIYVLIDPITGDIRYVGKTVNPRRREKNHFSNTRKNHYKGNWINKLKALGRRPIMEIVEKVESCVDHEWKPRESHWIEYFKALGSPLTNLDSGGTPGQNTHCAETRRKISLNQMGKKLSPEHIEKMRENALNRDPEINRRIGMSLRGKKPSAETLAKRSAALKGRTFSPESIERMRIAQRKRIRTPAQIEKLKLGYEAHKIEIAIKTSARRTGSIDTPETREKKRLKLIGRPVSEETRQKLSASNMGNKSRLGAVTSEETKEKMRQAALGRKMSEETKRKISETKLAASKALTAPQLHAEPAI